MVARHLTTDVVNHFTTEITFDGSAGAGAIGEVPICSVGGQIMLIRGCTYCLTSLAGAGATIEMGSTATPAGIIAQTTATDIDAGEFWNNTSPTAGIGTLFGDISVAADIVYTIGTAAITAGKLEISIMYVPLSVDGRIIT